MKRFKINLFDLDEIGSREFDFSVFIIMLCISFRNYFRGYGFATHLNSDLLFEMMLLLFPVSLLIFNKMTNKEVANIFTSYKSLLFPFLGGIVYIGLGFLFIHLAHLTPYIDFILNIIGLAILIAGIINLLVSILIFVIKRRVSSEKNI
ncbi:hypothetical protein A4V13_12005 [Staphylococcus capitis]|uniref:hypothetical protein n=1 Tax=Staphylococcus capitis TaxID=29388 RepID=UPI0007DA491F|nr:hypothetical protein [Staphylococcus capitis]OAN21529.1 hypothetical protein A4V13_12005 [Staphylococcus capitis]